MHPSKIKKNITTLAQFNKLHILKVSKRLQTEIDEGQRLVALSEGKTDLAGIRDENKSVQKGRT
jgi:hypothetical protein